MLEIPITVEPVTPARLADFLRLFDGGFTANPDWAGCYCMFYHQTEPGAWEAKTGEQNRAEKAEQIRCGAATGFLAYREGQAIGWCNAGPRSAYPLLHADPDVGTPGCRRDRGGRLLYDCPAGARPGACPAIA